MHQDNVYGIFIDPYSLGAEQVALKLCIKPEFRSSRTADGRASATQAELVGTLLALKLNYFAADIANESRSCKKWGLVGHITRSAHGTKCGLFNTLKGLRAVINIIISNDHRRNIPISHAREYEGNVM